MADRQTDPMHLWVGAWLPEEPKPTRRPEAEPQQPAEPNPEPEQPQSKD